LFTAVRRREPFRFLLKPFPMFWALLSVWIHAADGKWLNSQERGLDFLCAPGQKM
jgi:hypothetical protein